MGVSSRTSTTASERKSAAEEFRKMLKETGRKSRKSRPARVPSGPRKRHNTEQDERPTPRASGKGRKRSVTRRRKEIVGRS